MEQLGSWSVIVRDLVRSLDAPQGTVPFVGLAALDLDLDRRVGDVEIVPELAGQGLEDLLPASFAPFRHEDMIARCEHVRSNAPHMQVMGA